MRIELYGHVPFVEIGKWRNVTVPSPPAGDEIQIKQLIANMKIAEAQFTRWTFYEPSLIDWIKYMKSSASESAVWIRIWNGLALFPA